MKMLIDSFLPEGITQLAVDSIFMMPQLGVLSEVHEQAALEVFKKDCLIILGTCITPVSNKIKANQVLLSYVIKDKDKELTGEVKDGDFIFIKLPLGEYETTIIPESNINIGKGKGNEFNGKITGGEVGIIFDGRGRPFSFSSKEIVLNWSNIIKEYPQ